jgi:hypothetical protein
MTRQAAMQTAPVAPANSRSKKRGWARPPVPLIFTLIEDGKSSTVQKKYSQKHTLRFVQSRIVSKPNV